MLWLIDQCKYSIHKSIPLNTDVVLELQEKYILKNEIFTKNIQQHLMLFYVTNILNLDRIHIYQYIYLCNKLLKNKPFYDF